MARKKKLNINKIKPNYIMFPLTIFLFCIFAGRIIYLCTTDYQVGNETITAFIKNRNTKEETLLPKRGSIMDKSGNILAEDVASYTVIAYLDKSRSKDSEKPLHVVDPDITAEKLAPYLNMDVEELKMFKIVIAQKNLVLYRDLKNNKTLFTNVVFK